MRKWFVLILLLLAFNGSAIAGAGGARREHVALTVYSGGSALVSEQRAVELKPGHNRITLGAIADQVEPGSVAVDGDGIILLDQRLTSGALTLQGLLRRFRDRRVTLVPRSPASNEKALGARLVGSDGDTAFVETGAGVEAISPQDPWRIAFPVKRGSFASHSRLTAALTAEAKSSAVLTLTYLTHGMSWSLDYVGRLDESATHLRLTGLATINNQSGVGYPDARVRLVAGQPNQAQPPRPKFATTQYRSAASASSVTPQNTFEYYAYRLPQTLDVPERGDLQVPLVAAKTLSVRREYVFENQNPVRRFDNSTAEPQHAEVRLHVSNDLKQPLPPGTVRLYQKDGAGETWLGSDQLNAVPGGQAFALQAGRAFDVTAQRTQTAFKRIDDKHQSATWRIRVTNAKQQAVDVRLVEELPGDWRIDQENESHKPVDAHHVAWTLHVPANAHKALTYRVLWQ